jgi:hypothetical protein
MQVALILYNNISQWNIVSHTCNPPSPEAEARDLEFKACPAKLSRLCEKQNISKRTWCVAEEAEPVQFPLPLQKKKKPPQIIAKQ